MQCVVKQNNWSFTVALAEKSCIFTSNTGIGVGGVDRNITEGGWVGVKAVEEEGYMGGHREVKV